MRNNYLRWGLLAATLVSVIGLSVACSSGAAGEAEKVVTVQVTVPVLETRIVEVTREVERTVVVTATPVPTPTYDSPITAQAGTLTYPLAGAPRTLDPHAAYDTEGLLVLQQLYEGLFDLRGDGSTQPAAATGFVASADGTVYTVTLRSGLTWSDGQSVVAQHYVNGVCRLLDPAVGNPFYYLLTETAPLQGAAAYASGETADCGTVGITAVDELTLRITLTRPAAFLPKLLATSLFWPALPAPPADGGAASADPNAVTNGPYLLAEQSADERIVLTKNPLYWRQPGLRADAPDARSGAAVGALRGRRFAGGRIPGRSHGEHPGGPGPRSGVTRPGATGDQLPGTQP